MKKCLIVLLLLCAFGVAGCSLKEKNGAFTIGVGNVGTNKIDIIAFDINDNKLASNKKLKKEVLESVKTIMNSLDQEYKQEVLINAIDSLDIGNSLEDINYSEDIDIYMAREKNYFDIRIEPEHKNE